MEELQTLEKVLNDAAEKGYEVVAEEAKKFDCHSLKDLQKKVRKIQIKMNIISPQQL